MMRQKFDTAVRKIKYLEELQASNEKPLIDVICKCQFIRSLGIGYADFEGIDMPKFNKYDDVQLAANPNDLTKDDKERIEKGVKKRMEDENEIIKQLRELIAETDQKHLDLTLYQQAEIIKDVIRDVNNHLFKCLETCPLCRSPCNETHPEGVGPDSNHSSRCHRPLGFTGFTDEDSGEFTISFCNDAFEYNEVFKNIDTGFEWVNYKNYRTVNSYYDSWNITGVGSEDSLYWKYITYQVTLNLNRFFPSAKIPKVSQWKGISKSEAVRTINSLFHLDGNTITRNEHGFHYIKASEDHA